MVVLGSCFFGTELRQLEYCLKNAYRINHLATQVSLKHYLPLPFLNGKPGDNILIAEIQKPKSDYTSSSNNIIKLQLLLGSFAMICGTLSYGLCSHVRPVDLFIGIAIPTSLLLMGLFRPTVTGMVMVTQTLAAEVGIFAQFVTSTGVGVNKLSIPIYWPLTIAGLEVFLATLSQMCENVSQDQFDRHPTFNYR